MATFLKKIGNLLRWAFTWALWWLFQGSNAVWYGCTKIIASVVAKPILLTVPVSLSVYALLFYVLPLYVPPFNINGLTFFSSLLGLKSATSDVVARSSSILGALIPVSLTLYFFAYRAQQATSVKNMVTWNFPFIVFLPLALLTVAYGYHHASLAVASQVIPSQWHDLVRITIYCVLYVITMLSGVAMIYDFPRSINIRQTLQKIIFRFNLGIWIFIFSPFVKQRKMTCSRLHVYVETIYQLFDFMISKDIHEIYGQMYERWDRMLLDLNEGQRFPILLDDIVPFEELYKANEVEYKVFYKALLRSQLKLIATLYKNSFTDEAEKALQTFFYLYPRINELHLIYINSFKELAITFYDDRGVGIRPLLDGMEKFSFYDVDITSVYKWLVMKAVKENDVKKLTTIAYSMLSFLKEMERLKVKTTNDNTTAHPMQASMHPMARKKADQLARTKLIFAEMFLEVAIKSIELAHYHSTGFLVKFLVTNIESEQLAVSYSNVQTKSNTQEKTYEEGDSAVKFNINSGTFEYCLQKLIILIYAQQKYVIKNDLKLLYVPNKPIDLTFLHFTSLEYFFNKLDKAKSKYGFLYLEDAKFMKDLQNEIYHTVRNKQSQKTTE